MIKLKWADEYDSDKYCIDTADCKGDMSGDISSDGSGDSPDISPGNIDIVKKRNYNIIR